MTPITKLSKYVFASRRSEEEKTSLSSRCHIMWHICALGRFEFADFSLFFEQKTNKKITFISMKK